jgi:hypothetical protein
MHDWTLVSILFEWKSARVILEFETGGSKSKRLVGHGVSELHAPRLNDWGPSVSVTKVAGPSDDASGRRELVIEMQSGDHIRIVAKSFDFPQSAKVKETAVHASTDRD